MPGWLLHPQGPIVVRPSYLPRLIPWVARSLAASRPLARARAGNGGCDTVPAISGRHAGSCLERLGWMTISPIPVACRSMQTMPSFGPMPNGSTCSTAMGLAIKFSIGPRSRTWNPVLVRKSPRRFCYQTTEPSATLSPLSPVLGDRFKAAGGTVERARVTGFERTNRISGVRFETGSMLDCRRSRALYRRFHRAVVEVLERTHAAGNRARLPHAGHGPGT